MKQCCVQKWWTGHHTTASILLRVLRSLPVGVGTSAHGPLQCGAGAAFLLHRVSKAGVQTTDSCGAADDAATVVQPCWYPEPQLSFSAAREQKSKILKERKKEHLLWIFLSHWQNSTQSLSEGFLPSLYWTKKNVRISTRFSVLPGRRLSLRPVGEPSAPGRSENTVGLRPRRTAVQLWSHGAFLGPVFFNLPKCTNIHINSSPSACFSGLLKSTKRISNLGSRWRCARLINICAAQRFGDLEEKITLTKKDLKGS